MLISIFLHVLSANLSPSSTARKKQRAKKRRKVFGASHAALPTNIFCRVYHAVPQLTECMEQASAISDADALRYPALQSLANSLDDHMEQSIFSSSLSPLRQIDVPLSGTSQRKRL